jgi:DNA-binding winged helix-turn-helix (wHTH) protein
MSTIQIGEWTVDPLARTLSHARSSRRVSPKAMRVLQALVESEGAVVERDRLLKAGWPAVTVGEEVLTHAVAELRRAFAETANGADPIRTIYKSGYQLTAATAKLDDRSAGAKALASLAPYLAARCLSESDTPDDAHAAVRLYREAIAHDPSFADAHSGLALKLTCCRFCHGAPVSTLEHALEHARLAIDLDRSAPEPYLAYGNTLAAMGDLDGAISSFRAAIRFGPTNGLTFALLGVNLYRAGAFEAAAAACDRAAMLMPEDSNNLLRSASARRAIGDDAGSSARVARARARVERRLSGEPDDVRTKCHRVCCLVQDGEDEAALREAEPMLGMAESVTHIMIGSLARAGEVGLAIDQLEAAMEGGWSDPGCLLRDPDIAPLRREQRFERLTAQMR